ncbi:MAG TPA: HEAT repeat domain-containing protein [Ktedonobacterales bacterium]
MDQARTRRRAARAEDEAPAYRGVRALVSFLVALLALFCVVIIAQAPLAEALRALRRNPLALSDSATLFLGAAVVVPLCCAAIAYVLSAILIPVLRVGRYSWRLHRAVERQLRQTVLISTGLELRAARFTADGERGESVSMAQALDSLSPLLLLGEGGTGKTTALLRVAAEASRRRHLLALCFGRPLPVLLSLAELTAHASSGSVPIGSLDDLVRRAAEPFATRGLLASLPSRLNAGRLVLLCDELEALSLSQRTALCASLAAFVKSGGLLVASCRLDAYTGQSAALRDLDSLPRLVLEGADPDAISAALRRARPAERGQWHGREVIEVLRVHQLDLWAALPAHLAELHDLARGAHGASPLPFGRAQAAAHYVELATRHSAAGDDLPRALGALASSLLLARRPALPVPADLSLGAAVERWLAIHPPLPPANPAVAALDAERLETAVLGALDAGLLRLSADGTALRLANSVLQAQLCAYALAAGDDGFGWPAPELLSEDWVLPVILWSGLREEPVDVTRRLLHLADTPDTTAMRAGLSLREEVAPAIFALAIAALADALAARLAESVGTNAERDVTAQAEHQLRDLLDRVQVMLADSANIPRLASALRLVERGAGPELTEALGYLVTHAPLSRLLRGEIATLLGLLATPRALEIVIALLADTDPLTHQAAAQAVEWAGAPAVAALDRALASPDERVRVRAAELLARVGPGAEEGALAALHAANPTRRLVATWTLASVSSPYAEAALIERLADPDADVRRAAVSALGQLGTSGALGALMRLLTDPDPQLRIAVCGALGTLGESGDESAQVGLLHLLEDEDASVRAAAVAALGASGDERALEAIETRRDDPDPWVRNAVIQARRRFGRE